MTQRTLFALVSNQGCCTTQARQRLCILELDIFFTLTRRMFLEDLGRPLGELEPGTPSSQFMLVGALGKGQLLSQRDMAVEMIASKRSEQCPSKIFKGIPTELTECSILPTFYQAMGLGRLGICQIFICLDRSSGSVRSR